MPLDRTPNSPTMQMLNGNVMSVVLSFIETKDVARFSTSKVTNRDTKVELKRRTVRFKVGQIVGYTSICSQNTYGPVRIVRRTSKSVWFTDNSYRSCPGPHCRRLRLKKRCVRLEGGKSCVTGLMESFTIDGRFNGRVPSVYPDCEWDESKPDGGFVVDYN